MNSLPPSLPISPASSLPVSPGPSMYTPATILATTTPTTPKMLDGSASPTYGDEVDDDEDDSESATAMGGMTTVKIGRWTKQEHVRFMEAYRMFGKDWRRVAEYVGTRNNVQVRTHAQKSFKKLRNQSEFARMQVHHQRAPSYVPGLRLPTQSMGESMPAYRTMSFLVPPYAFPPQMINDQSSLRGMSPGSVPDSHSPPGSAFSSPLATPSGYYGTLPAFDMLSAPMMQHHQNQQIFGGLAGGFMHLPHLANFSPLGASRSLGSTASTGIPPSGALPLGLGANPAAASKLKMMFQDWSVNVK